MKLCKYACALIIAVVLSITALPVQAFDSTTKSYAGAGTSANPYRYIIDPDESDAKASWKSIVDLRYPFIASEQFGPERSAPLVKVLEIRKGNSPGGELLYSWRYDGNTIAAGLVPDAYKQLPYFGNKRAPLYLRIDFLEDSTYSSNVPDKVNRKMAVFLKFRLKTDITTGSATITVDVKDKLPNGYRASVFFYGGNTEVTHTPGGGTANEHKPYYVSSSVQVTNGHVTFPIRHGGNYVIFADAPAQTSSAPASSQSTLTSSITTQVSAALQAKPNGKAASPITLAIDKDALPNANATKAATIAVDGTAAVSEETVAESAQAAPKKEGANTTAEDFGDATTVTTSAVSASTFASASISINKNARSGLLNFADGTQTIAVIIPVLCLAGFAVVYIIWKKKGN